MARALVIIVVFCATLAGCVEGTGGRVDDPAPAGVVGGEVAPQDARSEVQLAYAGKTYAGACALLVAGPSACSPRTGDEHFFAGPGIPNGSARATLVAELDWTGGSPSEELLAQLWVMDDEGRWTSSTELPEASGPRPLRIAWDVTAFEGRTFGVAVHAMARADAAAATVMVFQERAFTLDGALLLERPARDAPSADAAQTS